MLLQELHFEIVQASVQSCTDIVEGMLKAANKDPEDDPPLELVMAMCHQRAQGACGPAWCTVGCGLTFEMLSDLARGALYV